MIQDLKTGESSCFINHFIMSPSPPHWAQSPQALGALLMVGDTVEA